MSLSQILPLLIPLMLVSLALVVVAVVDWSRRQRFRFLPKGAWLAVIVLVGTVGPVLYLALGRADDDPPGPPS